MYKIIGGQREKKTREIEGERKERNENRDRERKEEMIEG